MEGLAAAAPGLQRRGAVVMSGGVVRVTTAPVWLCCGCCHSLRIIKVRTNTSAVLRLLASSLSLLALTLPTLGLASSAASMNSKTASS